MEHHYEKRRDMARSILPSKNREASRKALSGAKRANRREIRQELTALGIAPDVWDSCGDLTRDATIEVRQNVQWRRNGDKLNHFIRWAIATTADLPIEDRLPHLRSIVGGGLIGDHAMSHLSVEPELRRTNYPDRWWRYVWEPAAVRESERKAQLAEEFDVLRDILDEVVVTHGELRLLNRIMKTCDRHTRHGDCRTATCVKRCLAGRHDIDQFLHDVHDPTTRHRGIDGSGHLPARRFRTYLHQLRQAADTRA